MTRVSVYVVAFAAFVAATAMAAASLLIPRWVHYSVTSMDGSQVYKSIGLRQSCSNVWDPHCRTFPYAGLCDGKGYYFCSMWATVRSLTWTALFLHAFGLVAFVTILHGGREKRRVKWKMLSSIMVLAAIVEFEIAGMVAYLYDHDEQFLVPGWRLDTSWMLCIASAAISLFCAIGLVLSAYFLPAEPSYQTPKQPRKWELL